MRRVKPSLPAFADALTATFPGPDDAPLAQALLRRLAHGEPVSAIELAAATDGEESEASGALTRWPNLQRDEHGCVVAFSGLSLLPTAHRFDVGGRQLYAWCAWDTLFLPAMLDQEARVQSRCPITGADIRLTVAPQGVLVSHPEDVWVSFPSLAAMSTADIKGSFCCYVHFVAGEVAAIRWLAGRDGAATLPLDEAFELGRLATRTFAIPDA